MENYCEDLAKNKIKEKTDLADYERKTFIRMCNVIKSIANDNQSTLSFKEHQKYNREMNPHLKYLIDSEF